MAHVSHHHHFASATHHRTFKHYATLRRHHAWSRLASLGGSRRHAHTVAVRATAPVAGAARGFAQVGRASFYDGRHRTADGSHVGSATCAHRSLPFGTKVLVTNLNNLRQAVLTVNDRGPFVPGRVIDVSRGAAGTLGMLQSGTANIRLQVISYHG